VRVCASLRRRCGGGDAMGESRPSVTASTLVRTAGMYVGAFDSKSAANAPGEFERLLTQSRGLAGEETWASIPHLNDLLAHLADRGILLAWVLVFDGVFRVSVEVREASLPEAPIPRLLISGVGRARAEPFLQCPSGAIVVDSLHKLGDPDVRPLVTISPGRYRARLIGNEAEEAKHQFLDDVTAYPEKDGPDWTLYLQKA
jgi:hypothetical protein